MKKYILIVLLFLSSLEAVTVHTQNANIDVNTRVIVSVTEMPGAQRDWVAIFPANARSTFANIVAYRFTNGSAAGDFDLGTVPVGNYEARAFAANTWHSSASYPFTVTGNAIVPTITTTQATFNTNQAVNVSVTNMPGANRDWVAIFPVGARNTFANIVSYVFTNGITNGDLSLGTVPAGNYEARAFAANSWRPIASHAFSVEGQDVSPTITTDQNEYTSAEPITVSVTNMPGENRDWVAIFPAGARNTFANIVTYRFTGGINNGDLGLGTVPPGNYEARSFFANSWRVRASHAFTVTEDNTPTIVFEDFETGNMNKWRLSHTGGRPDRPPYMGIQAGFDGSSHSGLFRGSNVGSQNLYTMPMESSSHFILELDQLIHRVISHGLVGVDIQTEQGPRRMYWDSWINHSADEPGRRVYGDFVILAFEHPFELEDPYNNHNNRGLVHYRFDIQQYLEVYEPGNHVTGIVRFLIGNSNRTDNITLSRN